MIGGSVQASVYNNTASLLSANRNNLKIGFSASNEITNVNGNLWNSVTTSSIPSYDALGVNLDGQGLPTINWFGSRN